MVGTSASLRCTPVSRVPFAVPTLQRIVRFAINEPSLEARGGSNGYAGSPPMRGLGRHYEVRVVYRGDVDPVTGYLIDIKTVDKAVRAAVIPIVMKACVERPCCEPGEIISEMFASLTRELSGRHSAALDGLEWNLSPTYGVAMHANDTSTVLLRQRFDFAAAHRLHSPGLSDEANRLAFGKCNNPSGHGHNYQFEPQIAIRLRTGGVPQFSLIELEELVQRVLIERFDHKHLNTDTEEFGTATGAIPSVENIAKVFYERLAPAVRAAHADASLRAVTVWETDRTSCTYPG